MRLGGRLARCKKWRENVTLTPSGVSGEGAETILRLYVGQVPPLRVHLFYQKDLPTPAQTLQPLSPDVSPITRLMSFRSRPADQ
jgi:hypothetical protein